MSPHNGAIDSNQECRPPFKSKSCFSLRPRFANWSFPTETAQLTMGSNTLQQRRRFFGRRRFMSNLLSCARMLLANCIFPTKIPPQTMNVNLSRPYGYRPLEGDRYIRLLHILDPDHDGGCKNPRLDLVHVRLDDAPPYETVSYAWGDPAPTRTLRLSSSERLGIAHNLNEALPYLVENATRETGYLWVDAICINQADLAEKDSQIPLMGDIYRFARRTIIWLGPELPHDQYTDHHGPPTQRLLDAMAIIDRHINTTDILLLRNNTWKYLRDIEAEGSFTIQQFDACIEAWSSILGRPLFIRAWTFQEWVLSQELHILIGRFTIEWESLMHISALFSFLSLQPDYKNFKAYPLILRVISRTTYLDNKRENKLWSFDIPTFCRILVHVNFPNKVLTSEPHDRIFGFLGLISLPNFKPNSNIPMADDLISFAHHIISATNSLDILAAGCGVRETKFTGIPSWVPDWSITWQESISYFNPTRKDMVWDAAKGLDHIGGNSFYCKQLRVRGRILDVIEKLSRTYVEISAESFSSKSYFNWQEFMVGKDGSNPWSSMELEDLFRILIPSFYGGNKKLEPPFTVGECVALFKKYFVGKDSQKNDESVDTSTSSASSLRFGVGKDTFSDFVLHVCVGWMCHRLAETRSGRFGLVPEQSQTGDVVAILHGLSVPIVLREDGGASKYRVVGDTYIEGIMFGEARTWEEPEADDIVLV